MAYSKFMDDLFSLEGKTVLVVGASSGIGKHAAKLYAAKGAKVIAAARRKELLTDYQNFYVDVSDPQSINDLMTKLPDVDVLLCTAGINIRKAAVDYTTQDWDQLMNINLKGVWALNMAMLKSMITKKIRGKIINITSVYGHMTGASYSLYATSKAALDHLTRSLALEAASFNICVNAIAPGYIETDLNRQFLNDGMGKIVLEKTPLKRLGKLSDLDGCLLLLATSASDYITGSIFPVDGGCSVHRFY